MTVQEIIVTGDQFIGSPEKFAGDQRQRLTPLACEMEGGAIAHVCYLNDIDFVVIRSHFRQCGRSHITNLCYVRKSTDLMLQLIPAINASGVPFDELL